MRSGRAHFSLLLAVGLAAEIFLSATCVAAGIFDPWPVSAFVTDPMRAGQQLVQSEAVKVIFPEEGDTTLAADPTMQYQEIEGYGAAITDSTLIALSQLPRKAREQLLRRLFDPKNGLNITYLRVPVGATDFGTEAYTYLDLPAGQTDPELNGFNFSRAKKLVSFLRHVKKINPEIRIMLSPWSPPAWMKTSGSLNGGNLKPELFSVYAEYLSKAITSFNDAGINIDTITVQNEPYFSTDKYPSMSMEAPEQITFIRDHLYPLLANKGIDTKILALDHNYDLRDEGNAMHAALGDIIGGIAYHCYGGTFDQMASTTTNIYQSECSGGTWGDPTGTFHFWLQSQVIGAGLLGSRLGMGWNLALDEKHGPYIGYCDNCRGLVDIDTTTKAITFNPELIAMAHAGKFLSRGARRVATNPAEDSGYSHIGYINPNGSLVHVVENSGPVDRAFVFPTSDGDFFRVIVPTKGAATVKIEN